MYKYLILLSFIKFKFIQILQFLNIIIQKYEFNKLKKYSLKMYKI